jgi:hypothetical protein
VGDDIGTVRWFGESWGAPVNDPDTHVDTPTHRQCIECLRWIESDDQGMVIPTVPEIDPQGTVAYHRVCFFDVIGIPHE